MDSFLHNHQSALDSFMEDKAIQDLEDAGIYPDPSIQESLPYEKEAEDFYNSEDDEPIDEDFLLMSSFGTKWHDGL